MTRRRSLLTFGGLVLLVIFIVLAVLGAYAPQMIVAHAVPQYLRAGYEEWQTKKIHLPPAAADPAPFSAAARTAAAAFVKTWNQNSQPLNLWLDSLTTAGPRGMNVPLPPERWDFADVDRHLAQFAQLTTDLDALVKQPDYDLQAAAPDWTINLYTQVPMPNFLSLLSSAKLWRAEALSLARHEKMAEAQQRAQSIFRAAQSDPYDPLVTSLIGTAMRNLGIDAWAGVLARCDDPAILRAALDDLNARAAKPFGFPDGVQLRTVDTIGELREIKRSGIAGDYQDLTGEELSVKMFQMLAEHVRRQVLPGLPAGSAAELKALHDLDAYEKSAAMFDPHSTASSLPLAGLVQVATRAKLYAIAVPNDQEARTRAQVANERLDLVRLATARKLYRLEKGREAADAKELVPEYLPALPTDRFATPAAPLRAKDGRDYSLGPDGEDDSAAMTYDPSNGTLSGGDVKLEF